MSRTDSLRTYALMLQTAMAKQSHKSLKGLSGKRRNETIGTAVALSQFLMGLALGARRSSEVLALFQEVDLPGFDNESMTESLKNFDHQVLA